MAAASAVDPRPDSRASWRQAEDSFSGSVKASFKGSFKASFSGSIGFRFEGLGFRV